MGKNWQVTKLGGKNKAKTLPKDLLAVGVYVFDYSDHVNIGLFWDK